MKKRALSLLLVLVMVLSLLPTFAAAAEPVTSNGATITNPDTAYTVRRDLVLDKTLTANTDGTFDIKLETYATGEVTTKVVTHQVPTDFVLVVDQSGSMKYQDMPTNYELAPMPNGGWSFSDFVGTNGTDDAEYYIKDQNTGDYYRVYRKWGDLFELIPRQSRYIGDIVDRRGLSWGQDTEEQEQNYSSQYYYRPGTDPLIQTLDPDVANDMHFYPLTITAKGGKLTYYIKFSYTDINGNPRTAKYYNGTPPTWDASYYDQGTSTRENSNVVLYRNGITDDFVPGSKFLNIGYERINNAVLYHVDNNSLTGAAGVIFNNTTQPQIPRDKYTFANIWKLTTGMYVQNPLFIRHVGYNSLAYRDANGVEHIIASTDYCDSNGTPTSDERGETPYKNADLQIYKAVGEKKTRLKAAQDALKEFVKTVAEQKDDDGLVDHRIALVGFSSSGFNNDELLTNQNYTVSGTNGIQKTGYNGADRNPQYYTNALIPARTANSTTEQVTINPAVTAGIEALTADGGTQPETGLEMAYNILNNNKDTAGYNQVENGRVKRNAVVIFFTDGRPGDYATDNQYTEANEVVAQANDIKTKIPGAQIYSVGVFGESDGNPLTYYQAISSWGWSTSTTFLEKDRLLSAFSKATEREKTDYNSVSPSLSNYSDYEEYAANTFSPNFYREDGTQSTRSFRINYGGTLGMGTKNWDGTGYLHTISGTYWRDAQRNTPGYPAQQNDTIADYMTVVSSTYPGATSFDGGWSTSQSGTYNTVVNNARQESQKVAKNYYSLCTDYARLEEVFTNIANDVSTSGTSVKLDSGAVLKDIVNTNVFNAPARSQVDAYSIGFTASENNGVITYTPGSRTSDTFDVQFGEANEVNISGFDYQHHYVMPNPPQGVTGQKLIVEIKNLTIKDDVTNLDNVLSNDDAGIYAKEGDTISKTPTLDIDSPVFSISRKAQTYVIDFNAKMKVATDVTKLNGATENVLQGENGKFVKSSTDVTYQLDTANQLSAKGTTVQINKAYSTVDTATVYGKLVNVAGDQTGWKQITTIPAGSVYFDDNLTNANAVTVGDGSGYNAQISASSPDAVNTEKGTYTFTFYGTGIDVYCTTYKMETGGYVQGKVDGNTDTAQTIRNLSETTRYNVPTISFRDLPQREHTLVLNVLGTSGYKLDGIRVYNPAAQSTYEGLDTHEQYAAYINMREALVNDHGVSTAFTDSMADAVLGALFVDDSSKMVLEIDNTTGEPKTETSDPAHIATVYASQFEAYKSNSPEHEIYLEGPKTVDGKAVAGQAIIFQLSEDAETAAANGNLWIGLSAPDQNKNTGTVTLKEGKTINVTSGVDMYYPITSDMIGANRVVTITNTGENMISVTNLKITGNADIYNAANTPKASNGTDGAHASSVEDAISLVFEPLTMQAVKVAANGGVDPDAQVDPGTGNPVDPGTPDQPDDPGTDKPTWTDPVSLLKTLFQSLLNTLGNLFKGLGGW